ncbi:hypothetical protein AURDEDRAFT_124226 [Auricularia subglabra TFB-10046 SS5]|nr:hypothetical protein AURDEDRAFT_124226 [Auricularia subglabra TFB-10046 SS5]
MQSTRRSSQSPATRARTQSATQFTASYGASLHGSTLAPTPAYYLGDRSTPSSTTYAPTSTSSRSSRKFDDSESGRSTPNKLRKRTSRPSLAPSAFPASDGFAANHVLRKMKSDISSRLHIKNVPDSPLPPPPTRQTRSKIPPSLFPLPPDDTHAEAVVVPPGRRAAGNCLFAACTDATGFDDEIARRRNTGSAGILVQTEVQHSREILRRGDTQAKQAAAYPNRSQVPFNTQVTSTVSKLPPTGTPRTHGSARTTVHYY